MKLLKGWKLRILTGLALASVGGQLQAQMMPGSMDPSMLGAGGGPMGPASYRIPGPPPGMAPPGMAPPGMAPPGMAPPGMTPPGMGGGPQMDPSMGMPTNPNMGMDPNLPSAGYGPECYGAEGGQACPNCGSGCGGGCGIACTDFFGRDRCGLLGAIGAKLGQCRGKLRPYGEGGIATQRWFDLYAEAMFLSRTKGASNFNTSSIGAGSGNYVLGTDQVNLNQPQAGLSLQANVQTGPGSNFEFVYFGLNKWDSSAQVTSPPPGSLFSFISNFGRTPSGGFDDTDRSLIHSLTYTSQLNNGEINFRRRWAEPYGFYQGSFLMGVRYLDLDEQIIFSARGTNNNTAANNGLRFSDYTTDTQNSLVGFQVGADLWYNLFPGVKLGIEGKTGIYNNRAHQITSIVANSISALNEEVLSNRTAYITQLSSQLYYRLNYKWAVRSSYQVICIDGVALAAENLNATPPSTFLPGSARTASITNDAEIVLQGFTIGAEYSW